MVLSVRLAQMALAFGMQVRIYKRQKPASLPQGIQYCEIDQLFEESDYLSLNCPLNEQPIKLSMHNACSKCVQALC